MRLRDLESALQDVRSFDTALQKMELEQYPTSPHLAARMVYTAATNFDDIDGKNVVDLGTGTGILALGCVLMGADSVVGIDADADALEIARENIEELIGSEGPLDLLLCDVATLRTRETVTAATMGDCEVDAVGCRAAPERRVDTVIMNPPFGTRNKGIDVLFLEKAIAMRPKAIYSLHKSSTRNFLLEKARRDWNVESQVIAQLRYDIPKMYKFHKKKSKDIEVDLLRFELPERAPGSLPSLTLSETEAAAAAIELASSISSSACDNMVPKCAALEST